MSTSVNITGKISGTNGYNAVAVPTIQNDNAINQVTTVTLIEGTNEIAVPANAIGCIIQPNSDNLWTLTLKRNEDDEGIQIHKTNGFDLSFDPAVTADGTYTFVVTSAAEGESPCQFTFH